MKFKTSAIEAARTRLEARNIFISDDDVEEAIMSFIEAGGLSLETVVVREAVVHPVEAALAEMRAVKLALDADVMRSEAARDEWRDVFDNAFAKDDTGYHHRAKAALASIGWSFPDYYDPETSYKEDVQAWISAFDEVLEKLSQFDMGKRNG